MLRNQRQMNWVDQANYLSTLKMEAAYVCFLLIDGSLCNNARNNAGGENLHYYVACVVRRQGTIPSALQGIPPQIFFLPLIGVLYEITKKSLLWRQLPSFSLSAFYLFFCDHTVCVTSVKFGVGFLYKKICHASMSCLKIGLSSHSLLNDVNDLYP